jgi:hypothetical protein
LEGLRREQIDLVVVGSWIGGSRDKEAERPDRGLYTGIGSEWWAMAGKSDRRGHAGWMGTGKREL